MNNITNAQFMEAIVLSSIIRAQTVDNFNLKISKVMDVVVVVKVNKSLSRQRVPWRNTMMVNALKREFMKAELKLRKTRLQILFDLY